MQFQLVGLDARIFLQFVLRAGVNEPVLAVERSLGGDESRLGLADCDGFILIPSVCDVAIANVAVAEEVEVVKGVAIELLAVVAALELELLVDVDKSA